VSQIASCRHPNEWPCGPLGDPHDILGELQCIAESPALRQAPTEPGPGLQVRDPLFAIAFAELLTEPVSFEYSHVPAQAIHRCTIVTESGVDTAQIEIRLDLQSHIATPLRDRQGALTGLKGAVVLADKEQMKARVEENRA
jgi:hypothetical protein